jgi:phosphoglycolate phosphatase-like HAD superfamily hydrolase
VTLLADPPQTHQPTRWTSTPPRTAQWRTAAPPATPAPLTVISGPSTGVAFDIDGTLATDSSHHLAALSKAARDVLGVEATFTMTGKKPYLNGRPVTGWVDAQCIALLAESSKHDLADVHDDFLSRYAEHYETDLRDGASPGTLLPGVADMLTTLADADIRLGLATGNASAIARAKMSHLGIAEHFTFAATHGFGDIHSDRSAVGRAAIANLGASGMIYLVGDTRADMLSARANHVQAVGVCSGAATATDLLNAGAHVVLADAADLTGLLGLSPGPWRPRPTPGVMDAADGWYDRLT